MLSKLILFLDIKYGIAIALLQPSVCRLNPRADRGLNGSGSGKIFPGA